MWEAAGAPAPAASVSPGMALTSLGRTPASAHASTSDTTKVAASGGLRVPFHPMAPDELPAAILGKA